MISRFLLIIPRWPSTRGFEPPTLRLGVRPSTENYLHSMLIKVIQSLDFTAFSVNFRKDKKTCFHLRNYSLGGKMVDFPPLG